MRIIFIFCILIGCVYGNFYQIALENLYSRRFCDSESLTNFYQQEIKQAKDISAFNAKVKKAISFLNGVPRDIPSEVIFESLLILFSDAKSPMCQYVLRISSEVKLKYYSVDDFLKDIGDALEKDARLYLFYRFAFYEDSSYLMRRYLKGKQIQLALLFLWYSEHQISSILSFEELVKTVTIPNMFILQCQAFSAKLFFLIESQKNDHGLVESSSEFNLTSDFILNHVINDGWLMNNVFEFLLTKKEPESFEYEVKKIVFNSLSQKNGREYSDWVLASLLSNYNLNSEYLETLVRPVVESDCPRDMNDFLCALFYSKILKPKAGPIEELTLTTFIELIKDRIEYVFDMYANSRPKSAARNFIVQLRRFNSIVESASEREEVLAVPEKYIPKIAQVHELKLDKISNEFPNEMKLVPSAKSTPDIELQNAKVWDCLNDCIAKNEWK